MKSFLPPNLDLIRPILWDERGLKLLDQRLLPWQERYLRLKTWQEVRDAIRKMVVRGAPAIGITAAIGLVLGAEKINVRSRRDFLAKLSRISEGLKKARPTAVNLSWAVGRMLNKAKLEKEAGPGELVEILRQEALSIWEEDIAANRRMGELGALLLPDEGTILTHCNAGALATGGFGTALGVIRAAIEYGKRLKVLADETRPWLQGARLTTWELKKVGIPVEVIPDGSSGYFMARGEIQAIVVGADRIAANGDVANKIGTYTLAVLAHENRVPFYVAAPISTIDLNIETGKDIPLEERPEVEVLSCRGKRIVPKGIRARNLAFDVTPSKYISAIVTERAVAYPPYPQAINMLFEEDR